MLDTATLTDAYDKLHAEALKQAPFGDLTDRDREILRKRAAQALGVEPEEVRQALVARAEAALIAFRSNRGRLHG